MDSTEAQDSAFHEGESATNSDSSSIPMRKSRSDGCYSRGLGSPNYRERLEEKKPSLFHVRSLSDIQTAESLTRGFLNQKTSDPKKPENNHELEQYREKLGERMYTFVQSLKSDKWTASGGFKAQELDEDQFKFYLLANQLIRYRQECQICLLCCRLKQQQPDSEGSGEGPKSHIFPKSLLYCFQDIHDTNSLKPEFIYDHSTPESGMISAKCLTASLCCSTCEGNASHQEKMLRDLYLAIMDPDMQDKKIEVRNPEWLRHILITIMLRGLFLTNFLAEISHNDFDTLLKIMIILRNYVKISYKKLQKKDIPEIVVKNFGVFILPDGNFTPMNSSPLFILDLMLRTPKQTSIVREFDSTFLYTQFDCFHCVLLIDHNVPNSIVNLMSNCFYSYEYQGKDKNFINIPASNSRMKVFPRVLVELNILRSKMLQVKLLTCPEKCNVFIERFPDKYPLPPLEWRANIMTVDSNCTRHIFQAGTFDQYEDDKQRKEEIKKKCRELSESSPLGKEFRRVCIAQKEQIKSLTEKIRELIKNEAYRQIRKSKKELIQDNEQLVKEKKELIIRIEALERDDRLQKEEIERLRTRVHELETILKLSTENKIELEDSIIQPVEATPMATSL